MKAVALMVFLKMDSLIVMMSGKKAMVRLLKQMTSLANDLKIL